MNLEISTLEEFIKEIKEQKLKEVRLYSYYKIEPAANVGSFTTFFIKLTTRLPEDIIFYEEPTGRDITTFEDKMKDIANKTATRIEEIKKLLTKEKLIVKSGVWRE